LRDGLQIEQPHAERVVADHPRSLAMVIPMPRPTLSSAVCLGIMAQLAFAACTAKTTGKAGVGGGGGYATGGAGGLADGAVGGDGQAGGGGGQAGRGDGGRGAGGFDGSPIGGIGGVQATGGQGGTQGMGGAGACVGQAYLYCDYCYPTESLGSPICVNGRLTCPDPPAPIRDCVPEIGVPSDGSAPPYARCQADAVPVARICAGILRCPSGYRTSSSCLCFVHDISEDCPDAGTAD